MERPEPIMFPAPGERLLRFVGDQVLFTLRDGKNLPAGPFRARLRTNLGRAAVRRREIISAQAGGAAAAGASWHDLPMARTGDGWQITLPLTEVGFFKAKAYLLDEKNWQHWAAGGDAGIAVHPNFARTANTIYCAFTRLFGATKNLATTADDRLEAELQSLEAQGYATLPPSGKFRDLVRQLPHIVQRLGCRILHLLPVYPTPVTYARLGRLGSPYAALDLTAVDPALVEFDQRTTGVDQFCELTAAAHALGARVLLDIVINHTGWGSTLQENHPEFFLRKPDGAFASPGAWGTTWADLVELEQQDVRLWDLIADSLLVWCRRGVDGFRCDAGYKVPVPAWQYIVARVQEEFPETIFLLEGLGGSWEATENLLTEGGMHWAYSELFQNYSGREVAWYLDYANRQSARVGNYIHYSETHDNDRLAARICDMGRGTSDAKAVPPATRLSPPVANSAWSLLRNRLCALTSPCGGFAFTCGVEWLATEKIQVHRNTGLNWDSTNNLLSELAQLNRLLAGHPCFFDGAKLTRLSAPDSPVYALLRESAEGRDAVLVLVNTDLETAHTVVLDVATRHSSLATFAFDLLGQPLPKISRAKNQITVAVPPGAAFCLAPTEKPAGLAGDDYRRVRAQAALAFGALGQRLPVETVDGLDWRWLAATVEHSPKNFLAAVSEFAAGKNSASFTAALSAVAAQGVYPRVVTWLPLDTRRIFLVPAGHWLLIEDTAPFRASLERKKAESDPPNAEADAPGNFHVSSIPAGKVHVACLPPGQAAGTAQLRLERHVAPAQTLSGTVCFLAPAPAITPGPKPPASTIVLLTNGIGGMARMGVDLGRIQSKYDCVLGANLNPSVPVDRHVFVKRLRVWVNADGFLSPLDFNNLTAFCAGPPAVWQFIAPAGDDYVVPIELRAEMLPGQNTVVFQFRRPSAAPAQGRPLPIEADVRLTLRADIEDRNFHCETKRNSGAEAHFAANCRPLSGATDVAGFEFTPAADRQLRVAASAGEYHPQPEWCENIPHPVEQTRGQTGSGDAYSPGWFEIPLAPGAQMTLTVTAERELSSGPLPEELESFRPASAVHTFLARLTRAAKQFVVRRDAGQTVIAGYPWFLDWGRDSLICARGLLAAGMTDEVRKLLLTFAKFEQNGTLPNTIHGNDTSNRNTSDAALWFAVACEDLAEEKFYDATVDGHRAIRDVLVSIAENYRRGTPNGIRVDAASALVWSPHHFTWMDTNYPAGTPREGYPVEIQVLWIRLLRQLEKIAAPADRKKWRALADQAQASLENLFWLEDRGWFADALLAGPNVAARAATVSDALRSNGLFAVSLGLVTGERARRCVEAARQYLIIPGALRTLAPLPVTTPLPIWHDGHLLNDPAAPYWPRYAGDEDTHRKPAYHNGTAWTWTFPSFCEALARAWDFAPEAVAAAKSYLGSAEKLLDTGCFDHLPEILDGDLPHTPRGCDAQAWGATETLRVWKLLGGA